VCACKGTGSNIVVLCIVEIECTRLDDVSASADLCGNMCFFDIIECILNGE
jgi:hypothetical protein